MGFKKYIKEAVIVPERIKITSNDPEVLNKQFKHRKTPSIVFKYDTGPHGAYVPKLDTIFIYLVPGMDFNTIETLINHEIIHTIQDKRSGMRMAQNIQREMEEIRSLEDYLEDIDDDEEIQPELLTKLLKLKKDLEIKMEHLNPEEEMAYAYMFVKMYKQKGFKTVLQNLQSNWLKWTNTKPTKRMLKYLALYWSVKDEL